VNGGFFLRKKPLDIVLPVYSNSENAVAVSESVVKDRERHCLLIALIVRQE
jgi:hypothetical protein